MQGVSTPSCTVVGLAHTDVIKLVEMGALRSTYLLIIIITVCIQLRKQNH